MGYCRQSGISCGCHGWSRCDGCARVVGNVINCRVPEAYYQAVRLPMLSLVRGEPNSVLEVGCASGQTLAYLSEQGARRLVGIECSPEIAALAQARGVGRIIVGDVERINLDLEPNSFDLIVAGHVLEHLADPWTALKTLTGFLRPGGQLVAGVPNVRHQSVVLPLLFCGRWRYQPEGIMDWTHLRFFSRQTIRDLMGSAGLTVERIVPEFGRKHRIANAVSLHLLRHFLAYAYNISAFKPGSVGEQSGGASFAAGQAARQPAA